QKWWNYLLSRWRIILIVGVFGGALGLLYAIIKKPVYVATATFVLEDSGQGGTNQYAGLASIMGVNLGNAGSGLFSGSNIQTLYQSRSMLQKALMSEIVIEGEKDLLI